MTHRILPPRPATAHLASTPFGPIGSLDEVRRPPATPTCDPTRQSALASELSGWIATARAFQHNLHVTLVIPDDTRPLPPDLALPPVLDAILDGALRRSAPVQVTVLVATGLHAPPADAFTQRLEACLRPFRAIPQLHLAWTLHDARTTEAQRFPLNPLVIPRAEGGRADCVVTVGLVEPHQYAGFSGGLKSLSIGCGATSTIASIHSLDILRKEGVSIGQLQGNPFRQTVDAVAASYAAPTFAVSLVPNPSGQGIVGLFAGATNAPFLDAVRLARRLLLVPVTQRYDFALISVPEAKSANFYQASRALTYIALHPSPAVRDGGTLIIQAACQDGFGAGLGEQTFRQTLQRGRQQLLDELAGTSRVDAPPSGGAQRAYMLARALSRYRCILVGGPTLDEAQQAGVEQVPTLDRVQLTGDGLIVDDPFVALPFFQP